MWNIGSLLQMKKQRFRKVVRGRAASLNQQQVHCSQPAGLCQDLAQRRLVHHVCAGKGRVRGVLHSQEGFSQESYLVAAPSYRDVVALLSTGSWAETACSQLGELSSESRFLGYP